MSSSTSSSVPRTAGPNCYHCRHFAVSWDPAQPYACRLMGFKSRALPAIEVLRVDGLPCQGFEAKPPAGIAPTRPAASPLAGVLRVPARSSPAAESIPDLSLPHRLSGFRRSV